MKYFFWGRKKKKKDLFYPSSSFFLCSAGEGEQQVQDRCSTRLDVHSRYLQIVPLQIGTSRSNPTLPDEVVGSFGEAG